MDLTVGIRRRTKKTREIIWVFMVLRKIISQFHSSIASCWLLQSCLSNETRISFYHLDYNIHEQSFVCNYIRERRGREKSWSVDEDDCEGSVMKVNGRRGKRPVQRYILTHWDENQGELNKWEHLESCLKRTAELITTFIEINWLSNFCLCGSESDLSTFHIEKLSWKIGIEFHFKMIP